MTGSWPAVHAAWVAAIVVSLGAGVSLEWVGSSRKAASSCWDYRRCNLQFLFHSLRCLSRAAFVVLCLSQRTDFCIPTSCSANASDFTLSPLLPAGLRAHSPVGTILARGMHSLEGVEHYVCLRQLINDPWSWLFSFDQVLAISYDVKAKQMCLEQPGKLQK